jgi:hypothetical protein
VGKSVRKLPLGGQKKYNIQMNVGNVSCEDGLWMELWIWLRINPLVGFGTSREELSVPVVLMCGSGHCKPITKQIINEFIFICEHEVEYNLKFCYSFIYLNHIHKLIQW